MSEAVSFGSLSLHYGADWSVSCCTYDYSAPILVIGGGKTSVSVSARDGDRGPGYAVDFARKLVAAASTYLAECERFAGAAGRLRPRAEPVKAAGEAA